jgi:hypothetical protein
VAFAGKENAQTSRAPEVEIALAVPGVNTPAEPAPRPGLDTSAMSP